MTTLDLRILDRIVLESHAQSQTEKARLWTAEEDQYLRKHLGMVPEEEIALHLGRTKIAVHLRWKRDLQLPAPSKAPDVITANRAAEILGIDAHKTTGWFDAGLLQGRMMPGDRNIRLMDRQAFRRWVLNPMNWPYFDADKVTDPELRRMLKKRAERWGDEWWSSRQVADYHGVTTGDVKRYIKDGRLKSFRLPFSLGGRAHDRTWSNHFILKSDAVRLKFVQGRGHWESHLFTPAADAWLLRARDELGMTFVHIGRTMKIGAEKYNRKTGSACSNPTISYRYQKLKAAK